MILVISSKSVIYETFCSMKLLGARREAAELPLVNKTMMYLGRRHNSGALSPGLMVSTQVMVPAFLLLAAIFL